MCCLYCQNSVDAYNSVGAREQKFSVHTCAPRFNALFSLGLLFSPSPSLSLVVSPGDSEISACLRCKEA